MRIRSAVETFSVLLLKTLLMRAMPKAKGPGFLQTADAESKYAKLNNCLLGFFSGNEKIWQLCAVAGASQFKLLVIDFNRLYIQVKGPIFQQGLV